MTRDLMQQFRGLFADLPNLAQGQYAYAYDVMRAFIGGLNGNDALPAIEDVGSVKLFGAIGDGVADDTQAILDAIAKYGYAFLPPGTYRTTSKIFDNTGSFKNSSITIKGIPHLSIIKPEIGTGFAMEFDGGAGHQPINIDGIALDGGNATGTAKGILFNRNMEHSHIKDLYVNNFPETGVRLSENWNMMFTNLEVRNCKIPLHIESDINYTITADQINNIVFIGGTLSDNEQAPQIGSNGGSTISENLLFLGMNTANDVNGWKVYNCTESHWDNIYLEQKLTADVQMFFQGCTACKVTTPHVGILGSLFKFQDCTKMKIDTLFIDKTIDASDIMFEIIDSEVVIENGSFTGGSQGTFLKYEQTGTKGLSIALRDCKIALFSTFLDETFNDGARVRLNIENNEGLSPISFDTDTRAFGSDRDGFVYLAPAGNKIAKLGNSETFGGTEGGWIECIIEGSTKYLRAYDTK